MYKKTERPHDGIHADASVETPSPHDLYETLKAVFICWKKNLYVCGVKFPICPISAGKADILDTLTTETDWCEKPPVASVALALLTYHMARPVHKDYISSYMAHHFPRARSKAKDKQPRHLFTQLGFNGLNDGERGTPEGYNTLLSLDCPHPDFIYYRRPAISWKGVDLGSKCMVCGSETGKQHTMFAYADVTEMQHGHKDPTGLTNEANHISMCRQCNGAAKDRFKFDDSGDVVAQKIGHSNEYAPVNPPMKGINAIYGEARVKIYELRKCL